VNLVAFCSTMFDFDVGWYFIYIGIGLIIGTISPLFGIGGGVFMVIIFLFLDLDSINATATALACVLFTTIAGSVGYLWKRSIDFKLCGIFLIFALPGSIGGGFLGSYLGHYKGALQIIFGLVIDALGAFNIFLLVKAYLKQRKLKAAEAAKLASPALPLHAEEGQVQPSGVNDADRISLITPSTTASSPVLPPASYGTVTEAAPLPEASSVTVPPEAPTQGSFQTLSEADAKSHSGSTAPSSSENPPAPTEVATTQPPSGPIIVGGNSAAHPLARLLCGAKWRRSFVDRTGITYAYDIKLFPGSYMALLAGLIASMLGLGGGIIYVPVLTMMMGIPPPVATATSTGTMVISNFAAMLTRLSDILWDRAILVGMGSTLTGMLVPRFVSGKIRNDILLISFWGLVILSANITLIRAFLV